MLSVIILRPLFEELASSVLSALIIFAMAGMIDVKYFERLWRISRLEFLLASLAFLGVLTFGVLPGVAIGVLFALVILVDHIGRPAGMVLGRTPTGAWADVGREPDADPIDGFVIYRQESPVVFVNARRTSDRLRALAAPGVRVIALDATAISSIDSTGFAALRSVVDDLAAQNIELWSINPSAVKRDLRALLDEEAQVLGFAVPRRFDSYEEALDAFRALATEEPPSGDTGSS